MHLFQPFSFLHKCRLLFAVTCRQILHTDPGILLIKTAEFLPAIFIGIFKFFFISLMLFPILLLLSGQLMTDPSYFFKRPDPDPCSSYKILSMHNSHIHGTAVLAVVPVITKHKILIHTQRNRLCSNSASSITSFP